MTEESNPSGFKKRYKRRRHWLLERYPYCPMCGVKMIAPIPGVLMYDDNLATIEHLNNSLDDERRRPQTEEEYKLAIKYRVGRTILLCRKCNNNSSLDNLPIEKYWDVVWGRGGRFPKGFRGKAKMFLNFLIKHI